MPDKNTQKLREIISKIKMTPITAPLVSINTQNHLLMCVDELEKLVVKLETEKEEAHEDHHEPEQGV